MAANAHETEQVLYQIEVAGRLDPRWSEWFAGLAVATEEGEPPRTTLTGCIDQAALRGIVNRLWDLNLILISVHRLGASLGPDASTADTDCHREEKGA